MKLKRLYIKGFKSFADKLDLEFDNGITCIVGPNGSGKSNIADAIRWVLGEQSAKSLRGSKMEEIIFSGTDNRKPIGMAEVAMTIDNSEGKLNTEFNEVEIRRRVYRSGEGEYYINGSACRLKDIYDLFYDTGIGKEGYSIIGQGKIEEILNSKPTERRSFFEEATGISKYRIRLRDTEKKLEEEQQNIVRVNDIISELTNQIEPLFEQSKKAEKYLEIRKKLEVDEVNMYIYDYKKAKEQLEQIDNRKQALENELSELNNEIATIKKEKEKASFDYNSLKKEIEEERNRLVSLGLENEKRESEIKVIDEKMGNAESYIKEANDRKTALHNSCNTKKKQYEKFNIEYDDICKIIESKTKLLNNKIIHADELTAAIKEKESLLEYTKNSIADKINLSYDLKNQKEKLLMIFNNLKDRMNVIDNEIKNSHRLAMEIDTEITSHKNQLNEYVEQKNKVQAIIQKNNEKMIKANEQLTELQEKQQALNKELNNIRSKYNIYVDMKNHHEGYGKSIKVILNLKNNDSDKWKGVHGVLGELIEVEKNYETALDVALGARIQNIVVDKEETAKAVINYLKSNKEGRATFLPINSIKSDSKQLINKSVLEEKGVLGLATDFIKYNKLYSNLIDSMLSKTIIVDTIDNAIAFSKKYKYSYKVVTLDGELFNIGGSITGGSTAKDTMNVFARTREIEELKANIEKLESEIINLHNKHKEKLEERNSLEKDIIIKNKEREMLDLELVVLQNNYETIEKSKHTKLEENNKNIEEKTSIELQAQEVSKEISYKEEQIAENQAKIEADKQKIEEYQASFEAEKLVVDKVSKEIMDLRLDLSANEQKKAIYEQDKNKFDADVRSIEEEIENVNYKLNSYKELIEKSLISKNKLIEEIEKEKEEINVLADKIKMSNSSLELHEKNISEFDSKIQDLSIKHSIIQDKIYKVDNSSIEYKIKMENIEEGLFEKYNLTYEEALLKEVEKFSYNKAKESIKQYKDQIQKLGNVNIDAIEQYKTISERYNFLVSQRDDIVEAEKKLKQIINELLEAMQSQFKYEFKAIDKNFKEIFKELFGGGDAQLKLVDEDDILQSGIDIIAQPPGKKLQNIMLLSGGEKALTAIALLFAILKMRPSPFCVLDEIEAALDDANVDRYARYIKGYSKNTQFLIITHRKGTMEISDYLYGVTMQEKGVSKIISVKLEEVE